MTGDGEGNVGGMARRVERRGVGPDEFQTLANFVVGELFEAKAKGAWVGERQVGFAGLGEIGEDFERVTISRTRRKGGLGSEAGRERM